MIPILARSCLLTNCTAAVCKGKTRGTEAVFADLIARLGEIENPAERAAAAGTIAGDKLGPKLAKLAAEGVEAFEGYGDEAARLGLILGEDVTKNADEVGDALGSLAGVIGTAGRIIVLELLPSAEAMGPDEEPSEPVDGAVEPSRLMTQKQFADARGWSKQYVNQLVRQGRIRLQNGKIDPIEADRSIARDKDPARDPRLQSGTGATNTSTTDQRRETRSAIDAAPHPPFIKARTVRENYRALRERLEYETLAEKLVEKSVVQTAAFEAGRLYRDTILATADHIGFEMGVKFGINAREATDLVKAEINKALAEIVGRLRDEEWGFDEGVKT